MNPSDHSSPAGVPGADGSAYAVGPLHLPGYAWMGIESVSGVEELHRVRHQATQADMLAKTLRATAGDADRTTLLNEARVMLHLANVPGIARATELCTSSDNRPCLCMDYYPQGTLAQILSRGGISVPAALAYAARLARCVDVIHQQWVIHRQVTPEHVWIDAQGAPRLSGFGLTVPVGARLTGGVDFSAVLWAPPEFHQPEYEADQRQDVWGLGVTTWALLTGSSPFVDPDGDNSPLSIASRVRAGVLPSLAGRGVPEAVETLLRHALAPDPAQRIPTAAAFRAQLEAAAALEDTGFADGVPAPGQSSAPSGVGSSAALAEHPDATRPAGASPADASPLRGYAANAPSEMLPVDAERSAASGEGYGRGVGPSRRIGTAMMAAMTFAALVAVALLVFISDLVFGHNGIHWDKQHKDRFIQPTSVEEPVEAIPPAPGEVQASVHEGRVLWKWDYTQPVDDSQSGDAPREIRFIYEVFRPDKEPLVGTTALNSIDSPAVLGQNCISVVARSHDGASSEASSACIVITQ